jgi:thiamine pyrophosphokinase
MPYFSTIAVAGAVKDITIKNAKYPLDHAVIEPGYQYGISNEVLPGKKAAITVADGRILLIRDIIG